VPLHYRSAGAPARRCAGISGSALGGPPGRRAAGHPDPQFGRLSRHFALLRDALSVPSRFISLAYASARPRSAVALAFEALITRRLARAGSAACAGHSNPWPSPGGRIACGPPRE